MTLSVVIPAYNEEQRIGETLEKISYFLDTVFKDYEIIVVDDCSEDKTRKIVLEHQKKDKNIRLLLNAKNKGKGYSVKKGVLNAKYDLILFSDADLATPIEEIAKFMHFMKLGYDVVIASRNMKKSNIVIKQPIYRQMLGKSFPLLVNFVLLPGIKDTQCGFKLFKKSAAKKIFSRTTLDGFAFDVEILYLARKYKLKVKELPVTWIDKKGSKVSPVRDSYRMFKDILAISMNNMSRRY